MMTSRLWSRCRIKSGLNIFPSEFLRTLPSASFIVGCTSKWIPGIRPCDSRSSSSFISPQSPWTLLPCLKAAANSSALFRAASLCAIRARICSAISPSLLAWSMLPFAMVSLSFSIFSLNGSSICPILLLLDSANSF